MVDFDHGAIVGTVADLVDRLGLESAEVTAVTVTIDETSPLGRTQLTSLDPVAVEVEGGALEDPKRPRRLAAHRVVDVVGRQLLQARDRLDADLGAPALDEEVALAHQVAWDTHTVGRLSRLMGGTDHDPQRQRRLYHFRNRHGFTDAADVAFARLWDAGRLTWGELTDLSDQAHSPQVA